MVLVFCASLVWRVKCVETTVFLSWGDRFAAVSCTHPPPHSVDKVLAALRFEEEGFHCCGHLNCPPSSSTPSSSVIRTHAFCPAPPRYCETYSGSFLVRSPFLLFRRNTNLERYIEPCNRHLSVVRLFAPPECFTRNWLVPDHPIKFDTSRRRICRLHAL